MGALNTGISYGVYLALQCVMHYQVAYVAAFLTGIATSYVMNAKLTFRAKITFRSLVIFPLAYALQYVAGAALLELAVKVLEVPKSVAPLLVIALTIPVTFVVARVAFRAPAARGKTTGQ
ncbi:MAG: GtrA family protein [Phycisphaerales bacterium]